MKIRPYTCQPFASQMREIFVFRVPGFQKMFQQFLYMYIAKDFRMLPKSLCPVPQMRSDMVWRIQTQHIAHWFKFTYFFESVSVKAVIAQIFQPGVRNWSVSVS